MKPQEKLNLFWEIKRNLFNISEVESIFTIGNKFEIEINFPQEDTESKIKAIFDHCKQFCQELYYEIFLKKENLIEDRKVEDYQI